MTSMSCDYDVLPVLQAIDKGEVPSAPDQQHAEYLVYRSLYSVLEKKT